MSNIPSLDDPMLKVPEIATIFGVKPYTVREWIKEGKLKAVKLPGGQWRALRSSVTTFAQEMYGDNSE